MVSGAAGGRQNVYEYEDGGVHAISSVAGGFESFFLDASVNGSDVFFGSAQRLVAQDPGGNIVVYDARVDGGFPAGAVSVACGGEGSCRPGQTPPSGVFGAPPSATYTGPGNLPPVPTAVGKPKPRLLTRAQKLAGALKACKKTHAKSKKKRVACEAAARKRYGTGKKPKKKAGAKGASAGRASNDRGARR